MKKIKMNNKKIMAKVFCNHGNLAKTNVFQSEVSVVEQIAFCESVICLDSFSRALGNVNASKNVREIV